MNLSFEQAAKEATILKKKPTQDELGQLYGLYKQATVGDVNIDCPSMFNPVAKAKWNAWKTREGLSSEDAKAAYVDLVKKLMSEQGI